MASETVLIPGLRAYLLTTAGIAGAAVMVVEVVGSRVLGPLFGVSLFVWTALITVTLLALAVGYAAGGVLADRRPSADVLYGLVFLAGLWLLLVPGLRGPLLRACVPLGLRAGSLAAAAALFGPALLLLGAVSPLLVKLTTRGLDRVGRSVGLLSAISTFGSFAGTLLTGFVLIAYVGSSRVLHGVGATLVLTAAVYTAVFRRRPLALALGLLPLLLPGQRPLASKVMPNGTQVTELLRREGFYGTVQVLEYAYGPRRTRELVLDGLVQGGVDTTDGLPIYEFAYFLERLPWGLRPDGQRCLVIGAGAGLVPSWYERRGVPTDVVDINPDVLEAARDHFGFRPRGEALIADGRQFLSRPGRRYDYVILDVFTGDTTPGHLLTLEALRLVRERLNPGGVMAANLAGSLRHETLMTASVVRTAEQVFETVRLYPTFDPAHGEGWGNVVLLAHDGPPRPVDVQRLASEPVHAFAEEAVRRFLGQPFRFAAGTPALVLSDELNPLDARDAWLKERIRGGVLATTDWDVLS